MHQLPSKPIYFPVTLGIGCKAYISTTDTLKANIPGLKSQWPGQWGSIMGLLNLISDQISWSGGPTIQKADTLMAPFSLGQAGEVVALSYDGKDITNTYAPNQRAVKQFALLISQKRVSNALPSLAIQSKDGKLRCFEDPQPMGVVVAPFVKTLEFYTGSMPRTFVAGSPFSFRLPLVVMPLLSVQKVAVDSNSLLATATPVQDAHNLIGFDFSGAAPSTPGDYAFTISGVSSSVIGRLEGDRFIPPGEVVRWSFRLPGTVKVTPNTPPEDTPVIHFLQFCDKKSGTLQATNVPSKPSMWVQFTESVGGVVKAEGTVTVTLGGSVLKTPVLRTFNPPMKGNGGFEVNLNSVANMSSLIPLKPGASTGTLQMDMVIQDAGGKQCSQRLTLDLVAPRVTSVSIEGSSDPSLSNITQANGYIGHLASSSLNLTNPTTLSGCKITMSIEAPSGDVGIAPCELTVDGISKPVEYTDGRKFRFALGSFTANTKHMLVLKGRYTQGYGPIFTLSWTEKAVQKCHCNCHSGGGCPTPDTPITVRGGTCPAGDIQKGDLVWTQPEHGGAYALYPVSHVSLTQNHVARLTLEDGRSLTFAVNHKFKTSEGWKELMDLEPGDTLMGSKPGVVSEVEPLGFMDVVKITVDKAHTYETLGLLSHNMKSPYYERDDRYYYSRANLAY